MSGGKIKSSQGNLKTPWKGGPPGWKWGLQVAGMGSLVETVRSGHQPPGPDDGGPTEVLVVLSEADLPRELPRGRVHAAHDPARRPPAGLQATVCRTGATGQDHPPGPPDGRTTASSSLSPPCPFSEPVACFSHVGAPSSPPSYWECQAVSPVLRWQRAQPAADPGTGMQPGKQAGQAD